MTISGMYDIKNPEVLCYKSMVQCFQVTLSSTMEIRHSLTATKQTPLAFPKALSSQLGLKKILGLQAPKTSDTLLTQHKLPKRAPVTSASKGRERKSCPVSLSKPTTETVQTPKLFHRHSDSSSSRGTPQPLEPAPAPCVSKAAPAGHRGRLK